MFINGVCHHTNEEKVSIEESKKHMDENTHLKAYLKKVMAKKKKRQEELTAAIKTSAQ
jgi:hypothetical protein